MCDRPEGLGFPARYVYIPFFWFVFLASHFIIINNYYYFFGQSNVSSEPPPKKISLVWRTFCGRRVGYYGEITVSFAKEKGGWGSVQNLGRLG